ncbi:hypothetical protein [Rhizobium halophytocola]|uniref:Uncharacterized protein n=1 Tax=Rhizobium halophytocola TaxID=735519 RepID=A0ABS4E3H5_9HYPH|nr:hypothetical protein [Rhizobium halophytocola]MBP1852500.1 hypothetical protein [Rhizobium halophytocola]
MPCFCTVPADVANARFSRAFMVAPPPPPQLLLAAAIPALDPDSRLDMRIDAGFNPTVLPNLDFAGGALAQIGMTLNLAAGSFALDNLPQLEFEMQQAAASIQTILWPRFRDLLDLKIQPLINFAVIARLLLDLEALGIDPFLVTASPPAPTINSFDLKLPLPKLKMAQLLAKLPNLLALNTILDIPPLGDPTSVAALKNRLDGLAQLTPPSLFIPIPVLMKLALVLESLATIHQTFADGVSPTTLDRIRMMMRVWSTFPIPIPLQALALKAKLDLLPPLEDIKLGESVAGTMSSAFAASTFSPPKLAIAPFLNVVMALYGSMQIAVDMEPFDVCSICNCN